MPGDLTRREMLRRAAALACLPAVAGGCARRIPLARDVAVGPAVDGDVTVPKASAPELDRAGGAVVVHPAGGARAYLVANVGTGLIALQAECPHEGCELSWVQEDLQAECPCHGSRFASDGALLNPPARSDLSRYPADRDAQGNAVVHLFAGDGTFKGRVVNGQFSLAVADFPALAAVGGSVQGRPDGFPSDLLIVRLSSASDSTAFAALSPLCTHLGCTVLAVPCGQACPTGTALACPCHGSRFAADGTVTQGPAGINLLRYASAFDGTTLVVQAS